MVRNTTQQIFQKSFFLGCLLVVLFLAVSPVQAANSYKSAEHGFSFSYPDSWKMGDPAVAGGPAVIVHAKPENNFAANFNVVVTEAKGVQSVTREQLEEVYRSVMGNVKFLSFKEVDFRGASGITVDYQWAQGDYKMQQRQYLLDRGRKGYSLTFTALQSNFKKYEKDFEQIINSFKF